MIDATKFRITPVAAPIEKPTIHKVRAVPANSEKIQISRARGETHPDTFIVFYSETGFLFNPESCTFKLSVKASISSTIYSLTGNVVDAANGKVEFTPSAEQADLKGFFQYEIETTDAFGATTTIAKSSYVYR